jgi:hypothetical protein
VTFSPALKAVLLIPQKLSPGVRGKQKAINTNKLQNLISLMDHCLFDA